MSGRWPAADPDDAGPGPAPSPSPTSSPAASQAMQVEAFYDWFVNARG
jgi:hypothetical protein